MPPTGSPLSLVTLPKGFRAAGLWAGIKREGRGSDLGVLIADRAGPAAAMFTTNALLGAHIEVCRDHLRQSGGAVRAVVVNSGNANCATGAGGIEDARRVCAALAELLDCPAEEILPISTGAIGARLPLDRIVAALPELVRSANADGATEFARAIMTTDTCAKVQTEVGDHLRVTGIAKGSGMIHPAMATMLGFLLVDQPSTVDQLDAVIRRVVDRSFHRISVDGDTSPNDTVLLWSSQGAAASAAPPAAETAIESLLTEVSARLCRQIAADGEGATRLVTIEVRGATTESAATVVGRLIATSPLVKTAIAGRDPNWGRILSTAGRAGVPIDIANARVWIGDSVVFDRGEPHPEREPAAWNHLNDNHEVVVGIDLATGDAAADVWTCDLTADYVRINADYRT